MNVTEGSSCTKGRWSRACTPTSTARRSSTRKPSSTRRIRSSRAHAANPTSRASTCSACRPKSTAPTPAWSSKRHSLSSRDRRWRARREDAQGAGVETNRPSTTRRPSGARPRRIRWIEGCAQAATAAASARPCASRRARGRGARGGSARARAASRRRASKATLDKTEVRAPFDGIVGAQGRRGRAKWSAPTARAATRAARWRPWSIGARSRCRSNCRRPSLAAAKVDAPASIYLDAYPEHLYPGRVRRIWPTANRHEGTVRGARRLRRDRRPLCGTRWARAWCSRATAPPQQASRRRRARAGGARCRATRSCRNDGADCRLRGRARRRARAQAQLGSRALGPRAASSRVSAEASESSTRPPTTLRTASVCVAALTFEE
jgi:hypothetical protein